MVIDTKTYLEEIRAYFKNLFNDLQESIDTWKTNLSVVITFKPSKDDIEERKTLLNSKSVWVVVGV